MEFWLKSHLGFFFNFNEFGNLNWLLILLFVYFLITLKKRKRWELALAFVFTFSCLFLFIKGKGYPRYFFTLYPFSLAVIFLYGWEFIKKKSRPFQIGLLLICTLTVVYNYYHLREAFRSHWEYKVSVVDDYFPHELIKYINNAEDFNSDSTTLVCSHRHLFFYHTEKKGIDFRDPKMEIFNSQKNKDTALDVLKNQLKVKYILVTWDFRQQTTLREIITNDCEIVYRDEGIYLYRLREKELNKQELEKLFVNYSLLRNGSFESWSNGPYNKPDFFEGGDNVLEGMVVREEKEVKVGRYSAKITGDNFNFTQIIANNEDIRGKKLTCFVWIKTNVPNKYRIKIGGGVEESFSERHSGKGDWELLQANLTVDPLAEFIIIRVIQAERTGGIDDVVYVDGALLVEGDWNTFYIYKIYMNRKE